MKVLAALLVLLSFPAFAAETTNVRPEYFPHFRACLAKVRVHAGRCRILIVGDSTSWGEPGQTDAKTYAWPAQLARLLNRDLPSNADSIFGMGAPNGYTYNPSITSYSGNWKDDKVFLSLGGDVFASSGPGGTFTFTPRSQVDTFVVWYAKATDYGTFAGQIDTNAPTSVDTHQSSPGVGWVDFKAPNVGPHALSITNASGSNLPVNIFGIEAFDSTHPGISVINAGWSGSTSAMWTTAPHGVSSWMPARMTSVIHPDLTIIDLDLNDPYFHVDTSVYRTNLTTIVRAAQRAGDVILMTSEHGSGPWADEIVSPYVDVVYSIAGSTVPLIDNWRRYQSYDVQREHGWMFDQVHFNREGYADLAAGVYEALGTLQ